MSKSGPGCLKRQNMSHDEGDAAKKNGTWLRINIVNWFLMKYHNLFKEAFKTRSRPSCILILRLRACHFDLRYIALNFSFSYNLFYFMVMMNQVELLQLFCSLRPQKGKNA